MQIRGGWFFPKIVPAEQTVQKIIDEKRSLARFGDGEFDAIAGRERSRFQNVNELLAKRLIEVLQSDIPELMVAIADNYGNLDKYTEDGAYGIRDYMTLDVRKEHMKLLSRDRIYYNAYLAPYTIYKDKDASKERFEQWKRVWEKRNVLLVEGAQTRFGAGNDLLANALSIRRILIPPKNAFDRYDDILNETLKNAKKEDLILIAAGPTAGVLAYDLTLNGHQALDIGHLDIDYEYFLRKAEGQVSIATKYTNNVPGWEEATEDVNDPAYKTQVIADFS